MRRTVKKCSDTCAMSLPIECRTKSITASQEFEEVIVKHRDGTLGPRKKALLDD